MPDGNSVHIKENYENVHLHLETRDYNMYNWQVRSDFKTISFLTALQVGYTERSRFLCLRDSHSTCQHQGKRYWSQREDLIPGTHNAKYQPLTESKKVLMLLLCIKTKNKEGAAFKYISNMFSHMLKAQIECVLSTDQLFAKCFIHKNMKGKKTPKE